MAPREVKMGLALVFAAALWAGVSAQMSCTSTIISLSPCLSYIMGNMSTPSPSCCSQLSSVVTNQAQCLCMVLNGSASSMGLNINQTQALALPGACNVKVPPLSKCNAVSPAASPTGTPASPATPAATVPTASTPTTSPSTPTTSPSTPTTVPSASAPSATTTPTPTTPSTTPSVTSGSGSKTVPSTKSGSSDASSTMTPLSLLFFLLFIGSYASFPTLS